MFDGWTITTKNKEFSILRANGVISTIYLDNESEELLFKYSPKYYKLGCWITFLTIIILVAYFGYNLFKKYKHSKKSTPPADAAESDQPTQ